MFQFKIFVNFCSSSIGNNRLKTMGFRLLKLSILIDPVWLNRVVGSIIQRTPESRFA